MLESFFPTGASITRTSRVTWLAAIGAGGASLWRKLILDRVVFAPPFLLLFFVFVNVLQVLPWRDERPSHAVGPHMA